MPKTYVSVTDRRLILERAQGRCEYCLSPVEYSTQSFDIDHIVPVSKGGETTYRQSGLCLLRLQQPQVQPDLSPRSL